jgi:hypothetical protein
LGDGSASAQEVIHELITSENAYVQDLTAAVRLFLKPLEKFNVVTPNDIKVLFADLPMLLQVNSILCEVQHTRPARAMNIRPGEGVGEWRVKGWLGSKHRNSAKIAAAVVESGFVVSLVALDLSPITLLMAPSRN